MTAVRTDDESTRIANQLIIANTPPPFAFGASEMEKHFYRIMNTHYRKPLEGWDSVS